MPYPGPTTYPGPQTFPANGAAPSAAPLDPALLSAVITHGGQPGMAAAGKISALGGVAGDDLTFGIAVSYDGAPLDLTGYTVTAVIKPRPTSADSDGTAYTLTGASDGTCEWDIPHAVTVPAGTRAWHVRVTDSEGRVATAAYGTLTLAAA